MCDVTIHYRAGGMIVCIVVNKSITFKTCKIVAYINLSGNHAIKCINTCMYHQFIQLHLHIAIALYFRIVKKYIKYDEITILKPFFCTKENEILICIFLFIFLFIAVV